MVVIVVREFSEKKDCKEVERLENKCEVGAKLSLFTDLLGDPICRVRHSPTYLMLVAEIISNPSSSSCPPKEIVGMIRGCVKTVTLRPHPHSPVKVGYILGLRVSPSHRRMGIGLKLVRTMEQWFSKNDALYSYIATENDNQPSINLFTVKSNYSKFRTPSILVQPVFAHSIKLSNKINITKLNKLDAESLYRRRFSTTEFFPHDIDSVLNNKLNLGTFLAVPKGYIWPGTDAFLNDPPESWAVLSVWNCKDVMRLEVRGASRLKKLFAKTTRLMDRAFPWLNIPSVPEIFGPFGFHFLYGLGGEGSNAVKYIKELCGLAHNLGKEFGCGVVATEVASCEPLRLGIPHWKSLSCAEDLWCIKRLGEENDEEDSDWTKSTPGLSIFVDPREF